MRSAQKSNRPRGRGNRKPNGSNINRVYESAGPEGKVRGTPQQVIDKYQSLARDAQTAGDRIMAENFLQHAEHYQRLLLEALGARQERRDSYQPDQDQLNADLQGDGRTEGEAEDIIVMHPRGRPDAPREGGKREAGGPGGDRGAREPEVSGFTTIDSDGVVGDSLLVDTEDLSASQPPRRRRDPAKPAEETPPKPESQSE